MEMPIYELPGNLTEKIQTRWGEISVSMSDDNEICIFFDPNSSETDEDYFQENAIFIKFSEANFQTLINSLHGIITSARDESVKPIGMALDVQKSIYDQLKRNGFEVEISEELQEVFRQNYDIEA